MMEILHFTNREDWLKARGEIHGIGGSDAAAACGMSRYKSRSLLWNEKTGRSRPKNISDLPHVQMGVKTEGPMRELFAIFHPEMEVRHAPFDIYRQQDFPWLFATLDGELRDRATGDMGVLEIKKADCFSKRDWAEWDQQVPKEYFVQVMHQLYATGYSFAYLWALLRHSDGSCTLREYFFPRDEHEADIEQLVKMEQTFMEYCSSGKIPPAPLTF